MALVDFDKLFKEYDHIGDDFGFSAVSEAEHKKVIEQTAKTAESALVTVEDYKNRLHEIEKLIIPFMKKLHSTGDKEYIYWPNRQPAIEQFIEKIVKMTRG